MRSNLCLPPAAGSVESGLLNVLEATLHSSGSNFCLPSAAQPGVLTVLMETLHSNGCTNFDGHLLRHGPWALVSYIEIGQVRGGRGGGGEAGRGRAQQRTSLV